MICLCQKIQFVGIATKSESIRPSRIYQTNIKAIKTSENNRYLLHWDGKKLHGLEHVETSSKVVAILLTVTHEKREILLKIENETEGHTIAVKLTKIILETMNTWNIENQLNHWFGVSYDICKHRSSQRSSYKPEKSFRWLASATSMQTSCARTVMCSSCINSF